MVDTSKTCFMANAYYLSHDFIGHKWPEDLILLSIWQDFKESLVHFSTERLEPML